MGSLPEISPYVLVTFFSNARVGGVTARPSRRSWRYQSVPRVGQGSGPLESAPGTPKREVRCGFVPLQASCAAGTTARHRDGLRRGQAAALPARARPRSMQPNTKRQLPRAGSPRPGGPVYGFNNTDRQSALPEPADQPCPTAKGPFTRRRMSDWPLPGLYDALTTPLGQPLPKRSGPEQPRPGPLHPHDWRDLLISWASGPLHRRPRGTARKRSWPCHWTETRLPWRCRPAGQNALGGYPAVRPECQRRERRTPRFSMT